MADIKKREEAIKDRRKQTTFRDFVKEIVGYYSLNLYKDEKTKMTICFAPKFAGKSVDFLEFETMREGYMQYGETYA